MPKPTALKLTLHRKWFDQIAAGTKKIEFREVKPFWIKRIVNRHYDEIHFQNGYSPTVPFLRAEYYGYFVDKNQYCLRIGKILEIKNY